VICDVDVFYRDRDKNSIEKKGELTSPLLAITDPSAGTGGGQLSCSGPYSL